MHAYVNKPSAGLLSVRRNVPVEYMLETHRPQGKSQDTCFLGSTQSAQRKLVDLRKVAQVTAAWGGLANHCYGLYESAWAAVTKYHRLRGLKQKFTVSSSGGR